MKGWSLENLVKQSFLAFLIVILASVVAYATGESGESNGHSGVLLDFGWKVLNFAILMGLLYWLLRDKIKEFFAGRRTDIKASLEEAAAAKEEAEKKFKEYSTKLDKATEEIEGISDMIRAQGLTEKEKIIKNARITAEKMEVDAQARIAQELKNASSQLRTEAVELSTQMAEEILKKNITKEDHENIVKDHLKNLDSQIHSGKTNTK